jgi:hypothetical protein
MKRALQAILAIALFGLAFSGYLSYRELFAAVPLPACPAIGKPGTVFGHPACIYGFFMYLAIVAVAAVGLWGRKAEARAPASTLVHAP